MGVRTKVSVTEEVALPLTKLKLCVTPGPSILMLGISKSESPSGLPPSNVRERVAVSPTATVSRSSVAVKVAAAAPAWQNSRQLRSAKKLRLNLLYCGPETIIVYILAVPRLESSAASRQWRRVRACSCEQ